MARLMILRPIHPLPGREQDAIRWLRDSEDTRRGAGQISQMVVRNVVDGLEYAFVQIWETREAYEQWRRTPERQRFADERSQYLTHDPTKLFEIVG